MSIRHSIHLSLRVTCALVLAACAVTPPLQGALQTDVLRTWGPPTARYALEGGERLEYATGPYGRTTWMIDIDRAGRVTRARQVLNEAEFLQLQTAAPGLHREELLRWLGTPGERRHGGWAGGQVWSWRYPTNDCLWFEISVADDGSLGGSAYSIDPRCDGPGDGRN